MPNDMVASIAKSGPEATVNIMAYDDGKAFGVEILAQRLCFRA